MRQPILGSRRIDPPNALVEIDFRPKHAADDLIPYLHDVRQRSITLQIGHHSGSIFFHLPGQRIKIEIAPRSRLHLMLRISPVVRVVEVQRQRLLRQVQFLGDLVEIDVPVPNVSQWRREAVGDLTSALALGRPAQPTPPTLPDASLVVPVVDEEVVVNALTGTFDEGFTYAPPTANVMPAQETTPARPAPPR